MADWKDLVKKAGKKASEMGKQAADETKKMVHLTDLSLQLRNHEGHQRELLQELGKRIYDLVSKGKAPEMLTVLGAETLNKLKTVENEIALVKAEIERVKKGETEAAEAPPPPGFETKAAAPGAPPTPPAAVPPPPEDKGTRS